MIKKTFTMTSFLKDMRIATLAVALLFASATPFVAQANILDNSADFVTSSLDSIISSINTDIGGETVSGSGSQSVTSSSISQSVCAISISDSTVNFGDSVTFSWSASNFSSLTINGTTVTSGSYEQTITNIGTNIFQIAGFDNNGNPCAAQIIVTCNPIPVDCRLDIIKTVDKSSAKPGDELTYTITVKNVGTTNCTGSGVKLVDEIDSNIEYLRHTLTSNFSAGYDAGAIEYDFYEAGSRTIYVTAGDPLTPGESGTVTWVGKVKTPTQCGDFEVKNQAKVTAKELNNFLTYERSNTVTTAIDYDCPNPLVPSCDLFTAAPTSITTGNNANLTWKTSNATRVSINNGIGNVLANGTVTVSPTVTTTYTLSVFDGDDQLSDDCFATVTVTEDPLPSCDLFTASPATIVRGDSATLTWETSNANTVLLNNGIGAVALDGTRTVSPTTDTTYQLTVIGAQDQTADCYATVEVVDEPLPVCKSFTATPSALPVGGGNVTLSWDVEDATSVTITPTIGSVALTDSTVLNVTESETYTLTATGVNGEQDSCIAAVAVADPGVFTCTDNVSFTISDSSIRRGADIILNWNVTDADSISISQIGTVSSTGSQVFSPSSDTTYTLTATNGSQTINCPVSVDVSSGGGGGGSSTPRCDLDISDTRITRGEEITLRWDTTRAREVEIIDDRGNVIVTTDDKLSDDKEDLFDGRITLRPTRDTEYTLTVERGSRDRECKVEVEIEDGQVLGEVRDQQPLVAGIALSQVPYTGFEAGPVLTLMFYLLLMAWALYIAYFLVARQEAAEAPSAHFATANDASKVVVGTTSTGTESMSKAEEIRPDVFAQSATETPGNLPTSDTMVGYESYFAGAAVNETQADQVVTDLENRAHTQRALLSSDAIAYFLTATAGSVNRHEALDSVIAEAKSQYPLEDGWIVLNNTRMQALCDQKPAEAPKVGETLPMGSGSLAEAIVTGNVVAAYEMIGNRPMFALAEAAADLDSVVRNRKGDTSPISDMLLTETKRISDEQLQSMITALTGAIDGTYTDEASAVKMSIMKAVKVIA